jgi:hypothetical protein
MMLWTAPRPARECHEGGSGQGSYGPEEPVMEVTTIGLDPAKSAFQVRGVDAEVSAVR